MASCLHPLCDPERMTVTCCGWWCVVGVRRGFVFASTMVRPGWLVGRCVWSW